MKCSSIFLAFGVLVAGCSKPVDSTESRVAGTPTAQPVPAVYPTLVVDEVHQMHGSNTPTPYQFDGAPGIWLDARQFHFSYGTNAVTPNMVQLMGKGSAYRLSHPMETNVYLIDRTTMEAVKRGPFPGFTKGERVLVAIGRSTLTSEKEDFWVSWVGQLEVR